MPNKNMELLLNALRNTEFKRDSAIAANDSNLVSKLNNKLDELEGRIEQEKMTSIQAKSSRFTRPKMRNVSQSNPSIGYAKPIQQQKISNKYHCIVSGAKRMEPCGGCSNPKGCLSSSMQYKEQDK
jgi:hypothetical protein